MTARSVTTLLCQPIRLPNSLYALALMIKEQQGQLKAHYLTYKTKQHFVVVVFISEFSHIHTHVVYCIFYGSLQILSYPTCPPDALRVSLQVTCTPVPHFLNESHLCFVTSLSLCIYSIPGSFGRHSVNMLCCHYTELFLYGFLHGRQRFSFWAVRPCFSSYLLANHKAVDRFKKDSTSSASVSAFRFSCLLSVHLTVTDVQATSRLICSSRANNSYRNITWRAPTSF